MLNKIEGEPRRDYETPVDLKDEISGSQIARFNLRHQADKIELLILRKVSRAHELTENS